MASTARRWQSCSNCRVSIGRSCGTAVYRQISMFGGCLLQNKGARLNSSRKAKVGWAYEETLLPAAFYLCSLPMSLIWAVRTSQ